MSQQVPLFINGEFLHGSGDTTVPVLDPATQQTLAEVTFAAPKEVDFAVASAREASSAGARCRCRSGRG
jgi:malonate-semialdehyde dehydrogenase (acetylating)/methylmalonate-semialdehyde dehydrogenase